MEVKGIRGPGGPAAGQQAYVSAPAPAPAQKSSAAGVDDDFLTMMDDP